MHASFGQLGLLSSGSSQHEGDLIPKGACGSAPQERLLQFFLEVRPTPTTHPVA